MQLNIILGEKCFNISSRTIKNVEFCFDNFNNVRSICLYMEMWIYVMLQDSTQVHISLGTISKMKMKKW